MDATLRREAQDTNPVALTDDNLIAAIKLYRQHCAICHGTAKGDPSASPVAKGLYPRPPQLASEGCGRRSRSLLLLENNAWHPLDRNAVMEGDAHRPADLEPCFVSQAYGQASACSRTGMAKFRELKRMAEISIGHRSRRYRFGFWVAVRTQAPWVFLSSASRLSSQCEPQLPQPSRGVVACPPHYSALLCPSICRTAR